MTRKSGLMLLVIAGVLCSCMLVFYQTGVAQSGSPEPTLANAVEARKRMVTNLEEIKELLKEQNALLRSGQVKVTVMESPKK
jgi:hypothetical protein